MDTTGAETTSTTIIHTDVVVLSVPVGMRETRANRQQQRRRIKVNMNVEMEVGEID